MIHKIKSDLIKLNLIKFFLKDLLKKLNKSQQEVDMLKEGKKFAAEPKTESKGHAPTPAPTSKRMNNNIYNHNNNAKLVKQYFNLEEILSDPPKIKLYIDKLNMQIIEKDNALKSLNAELEKKNVQKSSTDSADIVTTSHSTLTSNTEQLVNKKNIFKFNLIYKMC